MYIGQVLVKKQNFQNLFRFKLCLWQLQVTCKMENIVDQLRKYMIHDFQVASLILDQSNPLVIKFRMDKKQFNIDGDYNIRYDILEKE